MSKKNPSRRERRNEASKDLGIIRENMDLFITWLGGLDPATVDEADHTKGEAELEELEGQVDDVRATYEDLRDELQAWKDNLPVSLQDGDKAMQLDDAVTILTDAVDLLEGVTWPKWDREPTADTLKQVAADLNEITAELEEAKEGADETEFPKMMG